MNYLKLYIKLVRKAQNRTLSDGTYREKHHIFPVSIFGKNKVLVELTLKEHVVAHHLIYKACLNRYGEKDWRTYKAKYAVVCMVSYTGRKRLVKQSKITVKLIEILRNKSKFKGDDHPNYNHDKYIWKNINTQEILFYKTQYEMRLLLFPNSSEGSILSNIISLKARSYKGWIIVDENLESEYDKLYPREKYNWKNIRTGAIYKNKTREEIRSIDKNLTSSNTSVLVRLKKRSIKGWILIDDNGIPLYKGKVIKKYNWKNAKTDQIILNKTGNEMTKLFPELNPTNIYNLTNFLCKISKNWILIDGNNNPMYVEKPKTSKRIAKNRCKRKFNWHNKKTGERYNNKTVMDMIELTKCKSNSKFHAVKYAFIKENKKCSYHGWIIQSEVTP